MIRWMLQIRPYRHPTDEAQVVALWKLCDLTRPWNDPSKDIARKLNVQGDLFLVGTAEDAPGRIVATVMAGYEGHRGWINYLAVHPDDRRRGYARALMDEAERRLRAIGCPKINLQVRATNTGVIAFYEALGFAVDQAVSMGKRLEDDGPGPGRPPGKG